MIAINTSTTYLAGLDVGSTTIKLVVVNQENGEIVFSEYRRHNTDIPRGLREAFSKAQDAIGANAKIALAVTGSAGLGLSEIHGIPFLQEVVAAAEVVNQRYPEIRVLVDIGGEDAKMIFFTPGMAPDIRMNGSCAGGTGAFIDQVATLLGCEVSQLEALAREAKTVHPIASRCGVFAKTDIQNLLSRNVPPADIAASVFHAVAIQVVTTLARGRDILPKLMFCGGPLSFIPTLGDACRKAMNINESECILHENAALVPALGCAIVQGHSRLIITIDELLVRFAKPHPKHLLVQGANLPKLFSDNTDYEAWKIEKQRSALPRASLADLESNTCYLGIDSGSTTTKIVAIDDKEHVLFTFYKKNNGNPLASVLEGLSLFQKEAIAAGRPNLLIAQTAVTGYGEDLIKAAFDFDIGLVETIAHYLAAHKLNPDVSFILDIGGQDMKATFIKDGAIVRLDINEACSSGCGSFLESFANSLQMSAAEFAASACTSLTPCDLGTRCTVFMNSKVKQSLREGSPLQDIAAGLAYSVVKNCLYKVLKLKNPDDLGPHIVVQGGTMRNHAVVRALEKLTEREVLFTDMPELMGAYGSALHACRNSNDKETTKSKTLVSLSYITEAATEEALCPGCENRCRVRKYKFDNNNVFFSGNKCEKVFTNRGSDARKGENIYPFKYNKIFSQKIHPDTKEASSPTPKLTIGIPRALNYYENYPFWHALLTASGANVVLSARSTFKLYEKGARTIMSDNICFPAKLVHGHVYDLIARKVDRIFMPFVVFEAIEDSKSINTYNCPVVTGYSDVIKSAIDPEGKHGIPLDAPTINFKDKFLLEQACRNYIVDTLGLSPYKFKTAFATALEAQNNHAQDLKVKAQSIADDAIANNRLLILLAGRPYHTDPLIQHKIAEMISAFGVDVISEDIVRGNDINDSSDGGTIRQWAYTNRLLKSARWVAHAPENVYLVQLTSFGCGPDAFIADDIGDILQRVGKSHTLLKVDDINNLGSLRLRIRSLIESLEYRRSAKMKSTKELHPFITTPPFKESDSSRIILAPFFSETYSPFVPVLAKLMGYNVVNLPPANATSIDYGLKYANNEVCYPATLIVGDFVQALKSGRYKPEEIAIGITQTGGQCRASNYIALIKKALIANGYANIPVISIASAEDYLANEQPGFKLRWKGALKLIIMSMLYADRIAQMYNATAPRELIPESAVKLRDYYINAGTVCTTNRNGQKLYKLLAQAAADFNAALDPAKNDVPRIGIVGEIYVKYNSTGNKNIVDWLINQGVEPIVPPLVSFFLQSFPNRKTNIKQHISRRSGLPFMDTIAYMFVRYYLKKFDNIASTFRFHHPFSNIYTDAERASHVVNLAGQYGEGWLIPAELASFAHRGIHNAISLQPFGCIANHLISKGIENRIKKLYPKMSLLFLDLDSGASEANLMNRLHFMIQNARQEHSTPELAY